jgi:predicted transcriptional regulator
MSTDIRVNLGDEIRARPGALGLGQSTLAQAAGVGLTSLRDLEQHRSTPKRSRTTARIVATLERLDLEERLDG